MKMNEFASIIKESGILGKNKAHIIYKLMQAAEAKAATVENDSDNQSPSESTIKKWFSEGLVPRGSSYFPEGIISNKNKAHAILKKSPQINQWEVLRDLFKEWHDKWLEENQHETDNFCINTETEEFYTFSTSFWRQFASYFNVGIWDEAEEQYIEVENNLGRLSGIINEMIGVFKEEFMQYKVYEFIPKDIKNVINSLNIYYDIWIENGRPTIHESDSMQKLKRIYCKWVDNDECFVFYPVIYHEGSWILEASGEYILLNFGESFDYDTVPADIWLIGNFKYAIVDSDELKEGRFQYDTLSWKEYQSEIIIIDVEVPIVEDISADENYFVMDDCHTFIDEILNLKQNLDLFMTAIDEKIIARYDGVVFNDINAKLLYNDIAQYTKSLKRFKEYLLKFNELQKTKSVYFSELALSKQFDVYSAFTDVYSGILEKPQYPFSEAYLNPEEASEVETNLCYFHRSVRELYGNIFNYRKS